MKQINIDKIAGMTGDILGTKVIRSKTLLGESAKQTFYLYKSDGYEATLVIHKLVLSDDEDMWKDFEPLKTFKGKTLFFQHYSIRLSTLSQVIDWMNIILNPIPSKILSEPEFLYHYWLENDYSQSIMKDEHGVSHLSEADVLNIMKEYAEQFRPIKVTDKDIEKMGDDYFTKVGSVDNRKDIRFDYIQGLKDMKELLNNHKSNEFIPLNQSITIEDPKGLLKVASMEPYTPSGEKVTVTEDSINYGYDSDKEKANKLLKVGGIYTIDYTEVGGWHTDVYLKEFPGVYFNSVHFINVKD